MREQPHCDGTHGIDLPPEQRDLKMKHVVDAQLRSRLRVCGTLKQRREESRAACLHSYSSKQYLPQLLQVKAFAALVGL